jgi:hypothetical protein
MNHTTANPRQSSGGQTAPPLIGIPLGDTAMNEKRLINIFVLIVGLLGTLITVLSAPARLRIIAGIAFALLATVVAVIILWRRVSRLRRSQKGLLNDDALIAITSRFTLRPADKTDVDWIAAQEAEVYSADDAIPAEIMQEWFAANPYAFIVICDCHSARVGHLNILPIKPNTLNMLIEGKIRERDIRGDSMYSVAERELVSGLWVESIALNISNRYLRARALLNVFEKAREIIERLADPARLSNFYALSATRAGDCLIKRFGFQVASPRDKRSDSHDLYCATTDIILQKAEQLAAAHGLAQ